MVAGEKNLCKVSYLMGIYGLYSFEKLPIREYAKSKICDLKTHAVITSV
jgi:hypothetical protein